MSIISRKAAQSGARPRTETDSGARLAEFREREQTLTRELVELEHRAPQRLPAGEGGEELVAAAVSLISGTPVEVRPIRNVATVHREREVVRKAIELLSEQIENERNELQRQAVADRLTEWRALLREICVAALVLRRLNRKREAFKTELGGTPTLPCSVQPRNLFSVGVVGDQTYEFVEAVVAAGIMTRREDRPD